MYVQGTCAYQVYLTFSLVSIFGQWFGIILWSKKIRHTLLCPCSEWRVRTLTGNHEANRLGVTSSCTRVSSLVGPVRLQSSIVSVACGNQWYSTRPVSACWKSKATTRCEFVLQLQLVFEVALTVPWLYENGNLSVFRMWAHQKGPIWLDARAPALEFSGYCFWSWHQLWGSCEGGERSRASVERCFKVLNIFANERVYAAPDLHHTFFIAPLQVARSCCDPLPVAQLPHQPSVQVHVFASIAMWLLAAAPCWHLSPDINGSTLSRSPKLLGHFLIIHTFNLAKNTIHHNTTTNKKPFVSDLLLYGEQVGTIVSASRGRTPSFSEKTPFVPRGADSSGDTEATDCTATPTYWDGALRMDMDGTTGIAM